MDDADRVTAQQEMENNHRLAVAMRKGQVARSAHFCSDCGERIPEERREAVPGVQLCIEFQEDAERETRR